MTTKKYVHLEQVTILSDNAENLKKTKLFIETNELLS